MTKTLEEVVTLQQNLLHNPVYLVTPLIILISLIGAIFMTKRKAPFAKDKWQNDEYFRTKFCLCIALIANRTVELVGFFVTLSPYSSRLTTGDLINDVALFINPSVNITTWIVLLFIFLLSIQRYVRFEMIAAGTKRFAFWLWFRRVVKCLFVGIVVIYLLDYVDTVLTNDGNGYRQSTAYKINTYIQALREICEMCLAFVGILNENYLVK